MHIFSLSYLSLSQIEGGGLLPTLTWQVGSEWPMPKQKRYCAPRAPQFLFRHHLCWCLKTFWSCSTSPSPDCRSVCTKLHCALSNSKTHPGACWIVSMKQHALFLSCHVLSTAMKRIERIVLLKQTFLMPAHNICNFILLYILHCRRVRLLCEAY